MEGGPLHPLIEEINNLQATLLGKTLEIFYGTF